MLKDYYVNVVHSENPPPSSSSAPSSSPGTISYPIANFVNCDNSSMHQRAFLAVVDAGVEPKSFKEAMNYSGWREIMQKEISALEDNKT